MRTHHQVAMEYFLVVWENNGYQEVCRSGKCYRVAELHLRDIVCDSVCDVVCDIVTDWRR